MIHSNVETEPFQTRYSVYLYLNNEIKKGKLNTTSLRKILFSPSCLLEQDYIDYLDEEICKKILHKGMEFLSSDFTTMDCFVKYFCPTTRSDMVTTQQFYRVIFGPFFIKNGQIIEPSN